MKSTLRQTFQTMEFMKCKPLQTYYENARVLDFRSAPYGNHKIVLFCAHASNTLPVGYEWSDNDKKNFMEKHWAWDLGALDMAIYLASGLKCVLVHSIYSRLLVDVNRRSTDEDVCRQFGDNNIVELNKDLTEEEKRARVVKYHSAYYDAIQEVSQKINPDIGIGIHSFTPTKEGEVRELDMGIEYTESAGLAHILQKGMQQKGYDIRLNEPYEGKLGNALFEFLGSKHDKDRQGAVFEFRNDLLLDASKHPHIKQHAYEVLSKLIKD